MPQDISVADPSLVLELIEAFRRSKTMFAAVDLKVFDALIEGPKDPERLARDLKADRHALSRLLDACVGLGLLTFDGQAYGNTDASLTYLTHSSPDRFTGYIQFSNDVSWKLWEHLEDAVREGSHRWKQTFGWDEPLFSHFFKSDASREDFLMGMHGFGVLSSPDAVQAFDLSPFEHLVDVGGATGHLAMAACSRYPHMHATVFDLPSVVPLATRLIHQSNVADRIQVVAGDFFVDSLPQGDLYALGRIIHDWSYEKALALLKKIHAYLPEHGGLLIAEKILQEDHRGPRWAQMQDLNMLVCAEGQERTLAEYESLLQEAGFGEVVGCRTRSPIDAILARKQK